MQRPEHAKHLKMGVTLCGLGSPHFSNGVTNAQHAYNILCRKFPDGKMDPFIPQYLDGYDTIQLSNQYFTFGRDAEGKASAPFHPLVDPHGNLASILSDTVVHTEDNNVQFRKASKIGSSV